MEQSVPELEDLTNKGLFEKNEITMVMRRRTDFEHRIQGRGSKPSDYLRYASFEDNLEKLRRKRYERLQKVGAIDTTKSISDFAGVRRILYIYERASKRYPGDLEIWSRYLNYAKEEQALKRVYNIYSKLLQLQPRNVDAWLSAGKYEFDTNANARGARTLFQRGLKLNPDLFELWVSYALFELTYVSKLLARRQVLGLITTKQQKEDLEQEQQEARKALAQDPEEDGVEANHDVIALPELNEDELKEELGHLPEADMDVLGNPETNPVLRGDVALTVFDLCLPAIVKTVPERATKFTREDKAFEVAENFLKLFDQFENLNRDHLYLHVVNHLQQAYPSHVKTKLTDILVPLRTLTHSSDGFSDLLKLSVNKFIAYKTKMKEEAEKSDLTKLFTGYLNDKFLVSEEDKPSEKTVLLLRAIIAKCRA